jgi:hypothetical protein
MKIEMHFCACVECNLLNIYRSEKESFKEKGNILFPVHFFMGHVVAKLVEALRYKPEMLRV